MIRHTLIQHLIAYNIQYVVKRTIFPGHAFASFTFLISELLQGSYQKYIGETQEARGNAALLFLRVTPIFRFDQLTLKLSISLHWYTTQHSGGQHVS